MRRLQAGFTLIELLIVVAIIAILAAIAVPNFLEAQVRSKVARVNSDLRTLALAVESYGVDNNSYPMNMLVEQTNGNEVDPWIPQNPNYAQTPGTNNEFHFSRVVGLSITSPVAYISSVPEDPFHMVGMPIAEGSTLTASGRNSVVKQYLYSNSRTGAASQVTRDQFDLVYGAWRLWSGGPGRTRRDIYLRSPSTASMIPYDPTNGSISTGSIWRTQRSPDGSRPTVPGVVD
jgi:prepilin-type N-terminal cleavage/methylation domain-containing protein